MLYLLERFITGYPLLPSRLQQKLCETLFYFYRILENIGQSTNHLEDLKRKYFLFPFLLSQKEQGILHLT